MPGVALVAKSPFVHSEHLNHVMMMIPAAWTSSCHCTWSLGETLSCLCWSPLLMTSFGLQPLESLVLPPLADKDRRREEAQL